MSRRAAEPIQVLGVIILVVIVVLGVAVFFFSGLSSQGGTMSQMGTMIGSNLSGQVNQSIMIAK